MAFTPEVLPSLIAQNSIVDISGLTAEAQSAFWLSEPQLLTLQPPFATKPRKVVPVAVQPVAARSSSSLASISPRDAGVHVGQADLPARDARKMLGSGRIVGVSTHNIEQARQAVLDGANYIGVGPFFKSPTKPRDFVAGPVYAKQVAGEIRIPAVAIAGITVANVDEVLKTGIKAVAVTAAVIGCDDARTAARRLKDKLR